LLSQLLQILLLLANASNGYGEAPELAARVARGELPPVEERLPEEPAVVEPVESIGRYGGSWRRVNLGIHDIQLSARLGYDPLVRWNRNGRDLAPGLAKSWEVRDDARTYVFHLRRGLKWSDGAPLTSADFRFAFEDVLGNKELMPVLPSWLAIDGLPGRIETPDPLTVVYRFDKPHALFLQMVAYQGVILAAPQHYLKQFHPKYADPQALAARLDEEGLEHWFQLFSVQANPDRNPELPTCRPFVLRTRPPAPRIVAERNPYYWKVDPAGNQLPYIDRIVYTDVQSNELATLKALAGDVDFQARRIDPANYPLFMENRHQGGYHVQRDLVPDPNCVYINQHSKDPVLRPLLQDRRFRIALSVAINREEIIRLLYSGMAEPSRAVASPYDPFYLPEYDAKYLEYDPEKANRLLDELGLERDGSGLRRLPDGRPFRQILNVFQSETGSTVNLWQLVADYWREVGLDFAVRLDAPALSRMQVQNGNSDFWAYVNVGLHWALNPLWYVPWESSSYFAPLYGRYRSSKGKSGIRPPPEMQRLVDWYNELASCPDEARRLELGHRILGQWAEECYVIGVCRNEQITIVKNNFRNVPDTILHSYQLMTPGYIGIEQFYFAPEDER
jgi:peptide/nickel transport system substrate-binding protein